MEFLILHRFDNYMEAHILMGRLEEEGIRCWLQDENTVTIDPILNIAVGGIKLMVLKQQYERAVVIFEEINDKRRKTYSCPNCGSSDIELVSTPRSLWNWVTALVGAVGLQRTWRCFQCHAEFKEPKATDQSSH